MQMHVLLDPTKEKNKVHTEMNQLLLETLITVLFLGYGI